MCDKNFSIARKKENGFFSNFPQGLQVFPNLYPCVYFKWTVTEIERFRKTKCSRIFYAPVIVEIFVML